MLASIGAVIGIILYSIIHCMYVYYSPAWAVHHVQPDSRSHFRAAFMTPYALVVMALSALFTTLSFHRFGITAMGGAALLYAYSLIILSIVDIRTHILPDLITKPLIALGILQGSFHLFSSFTSSLLGAVMGYGLLWTLNTIFRQIRKKEGIGYGDFKLLAAIGAWTGIEHLPMTILFSSLIGILVALGAAIIFRHPLSQATPFGPSLALAGIISLYYGTDIMTFYLSLFHMKTM